MASETNMTAAVAAIRTCETLETLNAELDRFALTGSQEIIDCLDKCMYSPKSYFVPGEFSLEEKAEFTKRIFLTGTWRLNEFYDRMGLPSQKKAQVQP